MPDKKVLSDIQKSVEDAVIALAPAVRLRNHVVGIGGKTSENADMFWRLVRTQEALMHLLRCIPST